MSRWSERSSAGAIQKLVAAERLCSSVADGAADQQHRREQAEAEAAAAEAGRDAPGQPQPGADGQETYATLRLREPTEALGMQFETGSDGVRITAAEEGLPWHRAGLPSGVLLTSLGGYQIRDQYDLLDAVAAVREKGLLQVPVTIAPVPDPPADTPRDIFSDGEWSAEEQSAEPGAAEADADPVMRPEQVPLMVQLLTARGVGPSGVRARCWAMAPPGDPAACLRHPPGKVGDVAEWHALVPLSGDTVVWNSVHSMGCLTGEAHSLRFALVDPSSGGGSRQAEVRVKTLLEGDAVELELEDCWAASDDESTQTNGPRDAPAAATHMTVALAPLPTNPKTVYLVRVAEGGPDPLSGLTVQGLAEANDMSVVVGKAASGENDQLRGLAHVDRIVVAPTVAAIQTGLVAFWSQLPDTGGLVVARSAAAGALEDGSDELLTALIERSSELLDGDHAKRQLLGIHPVDLSEADTADANDTDERWDAFARQLLYSQEGSIVAICDWNAMRGVVLNWSGEAQKFGPLNESRLPRLMTCTLDVSEMDPLIGLGVAYVDRPPEEGGSTAGSSVVSVQTVSAKGQPPTPPLTPRSVRPAPPPPQPRYPGWAGRPGPSPSLDEVRRLRERVLPAAAAHLRRLSVEERKKALLARERAVTEREKQLSAAAARARESIRQREAVDARRRLSLPHAPRRRASTASKPPPSPPHRRWYAAPDEPRRSLSFDKALVPF
eukprot:TRINITY_DN4619_c0_g1_i3.p1 TRINITY_DN4619_c0_g1~~TRINITY_DN4619_c0_g1_i3.p1  ORF type:complete len:723 (+),score=256.07 TRINITY_DN4619_c0_g1_i3:57-2225(+)